MLLDEGDHPGALREQLFMQRSPALAVGVVAARHRGAAASCGPLFRSAALTVALALLLIVVILWQPSLGLPRALAAREALIAVGF